MCVVFKSDSKGKINHNNGKLKSKFQTNKGGICMATLLFLVTILFILVVYLLVRLKYAKDFKESMGKRHRERRIEEFVQNAYKLDNLEAIHHSRTHIELIYSRKTLDVRTEQVIFVENKDEEKVKTQFEMTDDMARDELFDLMLEDTYFYMIEERYNELIINKKD